MRNILRIAKPLSVCLTAIFIVTVFFAQYVSAAMIGTEVAAHIGGSREEAARHYVHSVLAREEVRAALSKHGLDSDQVHARVDNLTDYEVIHLADNIDRLPAGGDALGVILGVALIVFLVLLITDIMGYTDIFPFVKKTHR
jgi:hypothetical protein